MVALTNAAPIEPNNLLQRSKGGSSSGGKTDNGPANPNDPEAFIVYPVGEEENIDIENWRYPESFAWGLWCSATMIHPRVAMTAAHCVFDGLDGVDPRRNG